MANGILDALSKHSMFSETLDTLNRDPSTAHQMKGFNFAQNFPSLTPTQGVYGPTSFVGPALSKGYQYSQELGRALLDGIGGITIGDALSKAKTQSDANIAGMLGKGFNMSDYQQNLQDFNIDDVSFARDFGMPAIDKAKGFAKSISDAVIGPAFAPELSLQERQAIADRQALNRAGLMSLDDAGLTISPYEEFAEVAKPGFNLGFAKQLGKQALTNILTKFNPIVGLIARGLGSLPGLTGVRGGVDLRGDTTFNTFARSTSIADFLQRQRNKRAREAAARRGEVKELQSRIDKGDFDGSDPDDAPGGPASNQDAARGGQYG